MIKRFIKINDNLYRGSSPSIKDVYYLKKNYNINKIISLDATVGKNIDRICKLLGIEHIIIPLNGTSLKPIAELLSYDLNELLIDNGPTFIHCFEGKDRTGMLIAMYRCKCMGWSYQKAINEAEKLGFGIGVPEQIISFYKKIIKMFCNKSEDNNDACMNIIENMREDQINNEVNFSSFAPFLDPSRQYPYSQVYNYNYDMYPTRDNYCNCCGECKCNENNNQIPLVGIYDNNAGMKGIGPVDNGGGFVNF